MDHETNSGSDSLASRVRHFFYQLLCVSGQVVIMLAVTHRWTDDIEFFLFAETHHPFQPTGSDQDIIVQDDRPDSGRSLRALSPGEAATVVHRVMDDSEFGTRIEELLGSVGGSIVHDHDP